MKTERSASQRQHTLMGCETEYAVTALDRNGRPLNRMAVSASLVGLATRRGDWLPGPQAHDIFLADTAARLYRDSGMGLCNLEYATPECSSPGELVAHVHAGDRIVADLAKTLADESDSVSRVFVSKCNVDYQGHTSGSHENYLLRHRPQAEIEHDLMGHLVTRVIYTGGGGFDCFDPGLKFVLSPRVGFLEHTSSRGAQTDRGIFTRKEEAHVGPGYDRLHLLCGEGVRSPGADYLRFGVTALIVLLIDRGCLESPVELAVPLRAMHSIVSDPACRATVALADGHRLTAIDIQRRYLEAVRLRLAEPWMPDWAAPLWHYWRDLLENLETSVDKLVGVLDWPTKQVLYQHHAERRGIRWNDFPLFSRLLTLPRDADLTDAQDDWIRQDAARRLGCAGNRVEEELGRARTRLERRGYEHTDIDSVVALRDEMFELDIRFGELGRHGLFAALERDGFVAEQCIPAYDIEQALSSPPAIGRAALRGQAIRRLAKDPKRYVCDWEAVTARRDATTLVDMSDPFPVLDPHDTIDQAPRCRA